MNETFVAMQTFNTLLMIEVELWSADEGIYKPMYLTLDTGASVTTISSEILYQLGYKPFKKTEATVTTASDVIRVKQFKLDKIKNR